MEPATVPSCILTLHRRFAAYTTQRLQELGLSFGMMYFVIYVGKHPGCTPSELTQRSEEHTSELQSPAMISRMPSSA